MCAIYDSSKAGHILTAGCDGSVCAYDTDKRQPVWKWNFKVDYCPLVRCLLNVEDVVADTIK